MKSSTFGLGLTVNCSVWLALSSTRSVSFGWKLESVHKPQNYFLFHLYFLSKCFWHRLLLRWQKLRGFWFLSVVRNIACYFVWLELIGILKFETWHFFIITLSGIVMQFAERIRHSCDKGSQSKSRSHIAKFAPFFFDRLSKNHAGIFKAQIMAENTENNKQLVNL